MCVKPWETLPLSQVSALTAGPYSHAFYFFGPTKDPSLFIQSGTNSVTGIKNVPDCNSEAEMLL